jgi:hypothetical protein
VALEVRSCSLSIGGAHAGSNKTISHLFSVSSSLEITG